MVDSSKNAVLLTGATGLVGGELLVRLLASRPFSPIYCIIRSRKLQPVRERRKGLLEWLEVSDEDAERVIAVEGDVTQKDLGLGDKYNELAARIVEVFDTAADVTFDQQLDEARRINRDGLQHMIDFALTAQSASGFRRFNYVSTAYVVGDVAAGPDEHGNPRFHNTYEQTKWEAEALLTQLGDTLPWTCYRPSVIMGNSQTGRTPHFRVLYIPIRWVWLEGIRVLPCDPNIRFDVVPVDYVADAIIALSIKPQCVGQTYNLTAGIERSITTAEFTELVVEAGHQLQRRTGEPLTPKPDLIPFEQLPSISDDERTKIEQIARSFLPHMIDEILFDDAETKAVLAGTGIECPSLRDYIRNLIYFAFKHVSENRLFDPRI